MKLPSPITWPKYPELARWLNQLRECVEAGEIKSSPGVAVQRTTKGSKVLIKPSKGGGRGSSGSSTPTTCPFDITLTPNGGDFDLTLLPGTVNSELPSSILSTVTYTTGSTVYVKIHCITNGKAVTSSSIVINGTAPVINQATASAGSSTLDIPVAIIIAGNIQKLMSFCGSVRVTLDPAFVIDKVSPSVGESPFTRWYQWKIEADT